MSIFQEITAVRIMPVIKIDDSGKAVPLVKALIEGGLPCAEITFRTDAAEKAIGEIRKAGLPVLLGAGTVLSTEQVDKAVAAGASFIVTPGLNPRVVKYCQDKGVTIIPGVLSPTEMELAMELGLDTVKFFPAEQAGGVEFIKAVSQPFPRLKFIPTGGINENNLRSYLSFDRVLACGGSWMVKPEWIEKEDYATITAFCKEAVNLAGWS